MRSQLIGYTGQFPPDGNYIVNKQSRIDGVDLNPGDPLPHDNGVRKNAARIQTLCRLNILKVGTPEATRQRVAEPKEDTQSSNSEDLKSLTASELRKRLKKLKLDFRGNKQALVSRLESALAS